MGKYSELLYDDIGTSYERKNKYLLELARLQKRLTQNDSQAAELIKKHKANKKNHPYNVALKAFKKEEANFLKTLNAKKKVYSNEIKSKSDRKALQMKVQLFDANEKIKFYESYTNLSYEAKLAYEASKIISNQLPEIIETYELNRNRLTEVNVQLKNVSSDAEAKAKASYNDYKSQQNSNLKEQKIALKEKRKSRLISEKALKNGIVALKRTRKDELGQKKFESNQYSLKEEKANLKFVLSKGIKRERNVLKSNISDLRRKTPVEIERTNPFVSKLTAIFPGLGQLLNKQYLKSILFFLATLFIYVIAIPYALGFGNYQGQGIAGLISLAKGGPKADRSLIFMIEGIVAIFLLIFAVSLFLLSYFDARKVEKDMIKGIRPRNWFETRTKIEQDGFPYLVSLPALIVIVFIVLVPITTTILLSFTGMDPKNQSKFDWVGLGNYKLIATGSGLAGSVFWSILGWTLIWTLTATTLAILVGFMLAIIANNDRIKGKTFFRVIYLLPWAVPAFITIMFFSIMFSADGSITQLIERVFKVHLEVKNDPFLARVTLIMLQTWLGSSYVFLLSTGVLQAIPGDLYEAAQIDGATEWQKLKRITIPIVLFQTAPLLVGQYTFNFNNFSIIYLFNSGGPFNPSKYGNLAGTTDLLISYIYKLTMENQYQSIGAAITIVISAGLMLFAFIGFKNSKAFKEERL